MLDGEVVALDHDGRAQFQLLQNYQRTGQGQLAYYVFDLLYLDGGDLRSLPLRRRKQILAEIISDGLRSVSANTSKTRELLSIEPRLDRAWKGSWPKTRRSPYRTGQRSTAWLKIKTQRRQEAVIGGFTEPRRSRPHLGSLLLGVYDGDDFIYIGHTGGGFDAAGLFEMRQRLRPLERTLPLRRPAQAECARPLGSAQARLRGQIPGMDNRRANAPADFSRLAR